jgi:hypothetical protein
MQPETIQFEYALKEVCNAILFFLLAIIVILYILMFEKQFFILVSFILSIQEIFKFKKKKKIQL